MVCSDVGTLAKKSKPVRLSIASMVVAVGAMLEEFVSTRYAHPTAALISPSLEKLHFIRHFQSPEGTLHSLPLLSVTVARVPSKRGPVTT